MLGIFGFIEVPVYTVTLYIIIQSVIDYFKSDRLFLQINILKVLHFKFHIVD